MADGMDIVIQALDMASEVFSQISSSAQEMFDNITGGSDEASSGVEQVGDSAGDAGSEMDNAGDSAGKMGQEMDNASQATDLLVGAMEGVVATEIASALNDCIDKAASYESQMNSLSLTFGESAVNSEAFKNAISTASETTGRAGGNVREYFNQMGIAGVKNTSLLSQSFESLSGRAVQTGGNIDNMGSLMQKMVLSGNVASRSLTQLGLSTDDLGRAMGVSGDEATKMFSNLSQEERLQILTKAMGDGSRANSMYKNSFEGMKQQLENQLGLTARNIGSSVLPLLTNGLKIATPIINGFATALGNPIIGGAVGTITAVAAGLIGLSAASKMAQIAINGYRTAVTIANTVSALYSAGIAAVAMAKEGATLAEILNTGMTSSNTAVKIVATAAHYALAVAQGVVTAAQWLLNAAMEANPIGLVVIAVIALVAALYYLYNNNETVRAAVDALSSALQGGLGAALAWIQGAINNTIQFFQQLYAKIQIGITIIRGFISSVINFYAELPVKVKEFLTTTLTNIIGGMTAWANHGKAKAQVFINAVIGFIKTLPSKVFTYILNTASRITSGINSWVNNARQGARNVVSAVVNGISSVPGKVAAEFGKIPEQIKSTLKTAVVNAFHGATALANGVLNALGIHSPGIIQTAIRTEFENTNKGIEEFTRKGKGLGAKYGASILNGFGDVSLAEMGINTNSSAILTGDKGTYTFEFVHDLKNVPKGIDERALAEMINSGTSSDKFVKALAENVSFQQYDLKMKNRISRKSGRARGV